MVDFTIKDLIQSCDQGFDLDKAGTRGISKSLVSSGQILLTDLVAEKEVNVQHDELNPCP